jgi:hypothetical protein
MKLVKIQTDVEIEGGERWTVQIMVVGPRRSKRKKEPIKAELVKRLAPWVKTKIEKG